MGENLEPVEETPGGTKVVVINNFDALADLESIAASQGVTEADLQGEMLIVDDAGKTFTWDTFTPDAKFPIKIQFNRKRQQRRGPRAVAGTAQESDCLDLCLAGGRHQQGTL